MVASLLVCLWLWLRAVAAIESKDSNLGASNAQRFLLILKSTGHDGPLLPTIVGAASNAPSGGNSRERRRGNNDGPKRKRR